MKCWGPDTENYTYADGPRLDGRVAPRTYHLHVTPAI
jgi:hypothetical protein